MIAPALALTVVVHFINLAGAPAPIVRDAQAEAVEMLRDVGVEIEWTSTSAPNAVLLTLLPEPLGTFAGREQPVLGVATRTSLGTGSAWVFYQRVEEESDRYLAPVARVLACAMAHEIGHLLQKVPRHDDGGLMRGTWQRAEFRRAATGRLRFETGPIQ